MLVQYTYQSYVKILHMHNTAIYMYLYNCTIYLGRQHSVYYCTLAPFKHLSTSGLHTAMHVELVQVVLMNTVTTHISHHAFRITTIYIYFTVYGSALAWSMPVMLLPIIPIRLLISGLAWYLSVIHNKQSSHQYITKPSILVL